MAKKKKLVNVDVEKWDLFGILTSVKSTSIVAEVDSFLNKYIKDNKDLIPKKHLDVLNKILKQEEN